MSEWQQILSQAPEIVAPRLLGAEFVRKIDGKILRGRIVETEAYHQSDAASHSYKGRTPRNDVMFGPAGHLYVYFTYGMHYCCNVVTGFGGEGAAVLLRAIEPLEGVDVMALNRGGRSGHDMTNGPAKLCQAFAIDTSWNGHDLAEEPIRLILKEPIAQDDIVVTPRIGISQAKDVPWRFLIRGNPYVSGTKAMVG